MNSGARIDQRLAEHAANLASLYFPPGRILSDRVKTLLFTEGDRVWVFHRPPDIPGDRLVFAARFCRPATR
jgi:hypothetical protein